MRLPNWLSRGRARNRTRALVAALLVPTPLLLYILWISRRLLANQGFWVSHPDADSDRMWKLSLAAVIGGGYLLSVLYGGAAFLALSRYSRAGLLPCAAAGAVPGLALSFAAADPLVGRFLAALGALSGVAFWALAADRPRK